MNYPTQNNQNQSTENTQPAGAQYDRKIVSAETAARIEREGENYQELPESQDGSIDTTAGYTSDREGLLNNFAVEPEMYVNERGDRREQLRDEEIAKAQKRKEINTPGGRGPGVI
ncbi:hypothetical protein [Spirulina major]|uniref:hypothetical protein n=1 Tax=Spirulina major TaxID=270636 RepID=UPI00093282F6|nr:hypothetical protein [Spirulina major]